MDFFFKNLESAQAQAKLAALNAQKTAKGFAEQVSKQSKTLADQVQANTQLLAEQVWDFDTPGLTCACWPTGAHAVITSMVLQCPALGQVGQACLCLSEICLTMLF